MYLVKKGIDAFVSKYAGVSFLSIVLLVYLILVYLRHRGWQIKPAIKIHNHKRRLDWIY